MFRLRKRLQFLPQNSQWTFNSLELKIQNETVARKCCVYHILSFTYRFQAKFLCIQSLLWKCSDRALKQYHNTQLPKHCSDTSLSDILSWKCNFNLIGVLIIYALRCFFPPLLCCHAKMRSCHCTAPKHPGLCEVRKYNYEKWHHWLKAMGGCLHTPPSHHLETWLIHSQELIFNSETRRRRE